MNPMGGGDLARAESIPEAVEVALADLEVD
jgi:hypothetical protein